MQEALVYIVAGFLESGKTRFMQEMLADEGFSVGERTLLLVCEEGIEEYDPELLRRTNTVMVTIDSDGIHPDFIPNLNGITRCHNHTVIYI